MPENPTPPVTYEVFDPENREIRVVVVHPPRKRYWLHLLLFLATVLSTLCIGARLQYDFNHNIWPYSTDEYALLWGWGLANPSRLFLGIPFSACLLGILTAHELGHYLICVRRRVAATLPFFIPAPTLIGTMGAFIRIQSPIANRVDLFDIGIGGPIAGFLVALPVLICSLLLSKQLTTPVVNSWPQLGFPLVFKLVHWMLAGLGSTSAAARLDASQLYLHPTAVAAWVGMFATSLNLLPGGQLDGGHIVYALAPSFHRRSSLLAMVVLIPLGLYYWAGWLLWAVVLRLTGRHPQVPTWPELDGRRKLVALFGLLMLALTFAYNPLPDSGLLKLISGWKH